ncbi:LEA_2 domain-containing protein [Cephalotus follicularis]|uniref:LEA_2 domain-containing protein n=1 Tax=Cephalotus follicularis TaxID=3775 RepID=A0A1Q3CDZ4_CEPFO|nr:LEA_2 domain-containing protein [Cephalotus follicularis]
MLHTKSDSDVTSLSSSSPRSPKRAVYYVQSPSRDSHDEDKSTSTMQAPTPSSFNSPMESPSHPSYGALRESSASRFSGPFRSSSSSTRKGRKRNDKGWPVIEEEGDFGDFYYGTNNYGNGFSRKCHFLIGLLGFLLLFPLFCFIIWGASRPYKPQITLESLTMNNFYYGEGSDLTGVPTKMLTMNCSLRMTVYNPATFFGIHVSASPIHLMYSKIAVATGELKKYHQPRKSHRSVTVGLNGNKVPLYGAGASLAVSDDGGGVDMILVFEVRSQGNVVGKLVRSKHRRHISCSLVVDSHSNKPIKLKEDSCAFD